MRKDGASMDESAKEELPSLDSYGIDLEERAMARGPRAGRGQAGMDGALGWLSAHRVAVCLAMCASISAATLAGAVFGGIDSVGENMSAKLAFGPDQQMGAFDALQRVMIEAKGQGIEAANAAVALEPRWGRSFGSARFESDILAPGQATLRVEASRAACEAWLSRAGFVAGLTSVEAQSKTLWASGVGAVAPCPAEMDHLTLLLNPSAPMRAAEQAKPR